MLHFWYIVTIQLCMQKGQMNINYSRPMSSNLKQNSKEFLLRKSLYFRVILFSTTQNVWDIMQEIYRSTAIYGNFPRAPYYGIVHCARIRTPLLYISHLVHQRWSCSFRLLCTIRNMSSAKHTLKKRSANVCMLLRITQRTKAPNVSPMYVDFI